MVNMMSDVSKIKVLHVAECVGGVDRYLRSLLKYSNCKNIMVLSQLYKKNDFEKLSENIEIMQMNHSVDFSVITEAIKLRKIIKKNYPDIVYAHSSISGAITRLACIGLHVKVIYNPHGWSFNMESGKSAVYVYLERLMAIFCNAIVCISEAEKKSAINNKICNESKLRVIYNGIDIDLIQQEEIAINIPNDAFVVGMVGRICKQKAPDVFVKMAEIVAEKVDKSVFVIVGDVIEGNINEREEIEELARKMGIKLIITGWVKNPFSYMKRFDVGCLFSRWEGFGLAIPEYMLAKVPVVATKVDAIPYLIEDGVNGLLIEKDDYQEAAKAVIELKNNFVLKNNLIQNGIKCVKERFDAKRVSLESEELYKELIK